MAEIRSVDPRTLQPNPNNPRSIATPPGMDEQLTASIRAIGIIQPPLVREVDGTLVITAGHRRVSAAVSVGLTSIEVIVTTGDDNAAAMESLSENLVRASMSNVDIWRAIERLESQGWNEEAIADALALPVRTVRRLKLLAHIHPPMLEVMGRGDMPGDQNLRTIASASGAEQAQVWKKHKPRKGEAANWFAIANALSKRRIPFSAAKFDDELAAKYGVVWEEDLFMPSDEDARYTTDVDGFFGAQQEWLENNLPKNGVALALDQYGQPALPKGAQRYYGKAAKGDVIGHYIDPRTAEVSTVVYRLQEDQKKAAGKASKVAPDAATTPKLPRPDVTQRGKAMIGDFRTDALHESLRQDPASDITLLAFLVMAFAGRNVTVESGMANGRFDREKIVAPIIEAGLIVQDEEAIRQAARAMLAHTLSCRDNASDSGIVARIAGHTIGAALRLPSMATEEFLSCLSRQALEREAAANGVRVETRVKDTRAGVVRHFAGAVWHYPDAAFELKDGEASAGFPSGRTAFGSGADAGAANDDDVPEDDVGEMSEDGAEDVLDDGEGHVFADAAD